MRSGDGLRRLPHPPATISSSSSQNVATLELHGGGSGGGIAFLSSPAGFSSPNSSSGSALKKKRSSGRSWIRIDRSGASQAVVLDKAALMKLTGLPSRDLRLMDPLFVYPSKILARDRAIVVSLEQIRCIIMADAALLMRSSPEDDPRAPQPYEVELRRRLLHTVPMAMDRQNDGLPFEFQALELALEFTCESLDTHVTKLENEIHPVIEELASSISTTNLEHVRRLKRDLLALTYRVQKVHDEIEYLMEDDGDMAEMYLTQKRYGDVAATTTFVSSPERHPPIPTATRGRVSRSAPVSPTRWSAVEPQEETCNVSGTAASWSKHGSWRGSSSAAAAASAARHVEELEMLLEAYFVVIDNTLGKLLSLKEYIDDTEDFINIKLDNVQNRLIKLDLLLTSLTFTAAIFAVVTGVYGMNFQDPVFDSSSNFNRVLVMSGAGCGLVYLCMLMFFKHRRILPL